MTAEESVDASFLLRNGFLSQQRDYVQSCSHGFRGETAINQIISIQEAIVSSNVMKYLLKDDGTYPNNERLSLLVYKDAFN